MFFPSQGQHQLTWNEEAPPGGSCRVVPALRDPKMEENSQLLGTIGKSLMSLTISYESSIYLWRYLFIFQSFYFNIYVRFWRCECVSWNMTQSWLLFNLKMMGLNLLIKLIFILMNNERSVSHCDKRQGGDPTDFTVWSILGWGNVFTSIFVLFKKNVGCYLLKVSHIT